MSLTSTEKCAAAEELIAGGKLEDAEFLLEQVLDSHPLNVTALNAKCGLLMRSGKMGEAKRLLQIVADIAPDDPVVLTNLANVALLENRIPDALEALEQAHAARPDYLAAILLLAQVNQLVGQRQVAADWLTRASALQAEDPDVLAAGAAFEFDQQNLAEARRLYEKAIETNPGHLRTLAGLAKLKSLAGDFDAAAELAKKAHLLAPQDPETALALAQVFFHSGALSDAAKLISRFKRRYPDYAPVVILGTEIGIALGERQQGLAEAAAWFRKAPGDAARLIAFLKLLKKAGEWSRILDMCDKLPEEVRALDAVVSLYEEALLALGRTKDGWQSWARRRGLPEETLRPPVQVALPPRAPLLDELVMMRYVDRLAREGCVDMAGKTPIAGIWDHLSAAGSIDWTADAALEPHLLADLTAQTILRAPEAVDTGPYLIPEQDRRALWAAALPTDGRPRVGVFWDARAPGLLIDHLKEVFNDLDVHIVSLQFDESRHQLRTWPGVLDAGVKLEGLGDLVNLVDCLDAVVGPDGIPLHVAGALGRKGVALLQENHEWYWAGTGHHSLWYPSVERIVMPVGPSWTGARAAVHDALETLKTGIHQPVTT